MMDDYDGFIDEDEWTDVDTDEYGRPIDPDNVYDILTDN